MGIDFHTYPLKITNGVELVAAEESLVMASSLKSHRHRKGEILALLLDFNHPAAITGSEIKKITAEAGKTFFETPGSVTNALQTAAGFINTALLERNLSADSSELLQAAGCFAVSHNGYLFVAQAGSAHIFLIEAESFTHFQNPDANERGLGAARRFALNFQQATLTAGDLVVLTTHAPATWDEEHLKGSHQLSMDQVHRRLMNQLQEDLAAVVIKCKEGKGTVQEEKWSEEIPGLNQNQANPEEKKEDLPANEIEEIESKHPDLEAQEDFSNQHSTSDAEIPPHENFPTRDLSPEKILDEIPIEPGRPEKAHSVDENKAYEEEPRRVRKSEYVKNRPGKKPGGQTSKTKNALQDFFIKLGSRLTADSGSLEGSGSSHLLNTIVIAIPLILITAAVLVYVYSGRREQHQTYLDEAQSYISQATTIEDASQQREYWTKAYDTVLKAREFGDSDLSDTLLTQTQTIIDDMDLVTRLDFRPATTSQFSQDVVLTKIKSNDSGIYLLDSAGGSIFRTVANSKGFYEVDAAFQCGPGTYGVITLGKIVDFTTLPTNTHAYEVLAVDAGGNLLYCSPENEPVPGSLIPPESEWGRIAAMSLDEYTLYVVDADNNRIWSFSGHDFEIAAMAGIVFSSHPVDFLGSEEVNLGGTVDLIVNKEDVFILHEDSHMTTCQYNSYREGNATECLDPTAYGDSRIGYEKNPLIYFDTQFRVIQETTYPNSAFYILDAKQRAVLQYSYQLNLERMLKPQPSKTYPLPETEMTGVGISTEKELFLAFGNQLYVGNLP
ncbi:MAG: hypothetical protein ACYC59_11920 [Anaerolineaceae bacterium]